MAKYSYSANELQAVENHIIKHFGSISQKVHVEECENLDLYLYVINPTKEKYYYTVITCGMGAYKMELPDDFKDDGYADRIEMLIYLSPDWNMELAFSKPTGLIIGDSVTPVLGSVYDKWNYPVRIIKNLAQAPVNNDSYFVRGNIMDDEQPFSSSTSDSGGILISPAYISEEGTECTLPGGEIVEFLQIMPITTNEIERAAYLNRELIFHRLIFHNFIIYQDSYLYDYDNIFDDGFLHLLDLYQNNIVQQSGELGAFNHMAALLRWLIEHNMLNDNFTAKYRDEIEKVKNSPADIDLRLFIVDKLIGSLRYEILKEDIIDFIETYFVNNPEEDIKGQYYYDIEEYAAEYFEENNADTEDMDDYKYVFMPYDENYYESVSKIIDIYYKEWSSKQ